MATTTPDMGLTAATENLRVLSAYRDAVARRAYWQDNGTRRDGKLDAAMEAESEALRAVLDRMMV